MEKDQGTWGHGCQMAKFDSFLSLDCARVEGVGRNPRKGRDQILPSGNLGGQAGHAGAAHVLDAVTKDIKIISIL